MPFYLVTQTFLIEAEDEHAAARIVVDQIRSGDKVAVTVRSDETTVSHVVVPAKPAISLTASIADPEAARQAPATSPVQSSVPHTDRKVTLKGIMVDALSLLKGRP